MIQYGKGRTAIPFLFLIPILIILVMVTFIPFFYAIIKSFTAHSFALPKLHGQFIGLNNFREALNNDPEFWHSILITLQYVVIVVATETILGIILANLLNRIEKGRRIFTSCLMIPMIMSPVVIGLTGRFVLNAEFGILPYFIKLIGIDLKISLLGTKETALPVVMLIDIWQWLPFMTLIALAGLQSVNSEVIEAAQVDGANNMQIFLRISLPYIAPVLLVGVLLRSIDAFRAFDKIFILTGGGPSSRTELVSLYVYRVNFKFWNIGYGAALILLVFLIVLILNNFFYSLTQKENQETT